MNQLLYTKIYSQKSLNKLQKEENKIAVGFETYYNITSNGVNGTTYTTTYPSVTTTNYTYSDGYWMPIILDLSNIDNLKIKFGIYEIDLNRKDIEWLKKRLHKKFLLQIARKLLSK